jgi:trk system potassium uptake protein TrkH
MPVRYHPEVRKRALSPAQLLSLHIAALILLGSVLLSLPVSSAGPIPIPVIDAVFTSTSAVCVTGLIVRDTPVEFSMFGQVVIMLLIQAGGLGYMTISTLIAIALGRRTSLKDRLTLADALNVSSLEGLLRFAGTIAAMTLAFEAAGALVMAVRFARDMPWGQALYFGAFHAVSAFNNAGFALFSNNLVNYRGDVTINLVITGLIIVGGLGFLVLGEVLRIWRPGRRPGMSTHSRFVLTLTGALLAGSTLAIYALEAGNGATLAPLPVGERWLAAWFQAVTPRTAGFNTIDIGAMTTPALFLMIVLMFIGASPGGTGGGVKTTTFGVTVAALWATVRGSGEVVIFKRRLSTDTVNRAFTIALVAFLAVNVVALGLLIVEGGDLVHTLFETSSAFGTVGLSMGRPGSVLSLSGFYGVAGKLLVMGMMFLGRVGPLTVVIALAGRSAPPRIRYPEGRVTIG